MNVQEKFASKCSAEKQNQMSATNSLGLWSHLCDSGAIPQCSHHCDGQNTGCVPTFSLPTQPDSSSTHSFSFPTLDKLQRASLPDFQGFHIQKWEKGEKMFRLVLKIECFFFLFMSHPFNNFYTFAFIGSHHNFIFIVYTMLNKFCLFIDLL